MISTQRCQEKLPRRITESEADAAEFVSVPLALPVLCRNETGQILKSMRRHAHHRGVGRNISQDYGAGANARKRADARVRQHHGV